MEGLAYIEDTPEGAWRSFWAAAICLPAFLALRLLAWAANDDPAGGVLRGLSAELLGYVVAWAGFALASLPLARMWGREAAWPRFLAAWNWTNVVQYLVLVVLTLPGLLGLPLALAQVLSLAGLAYAVWLEWFVARHALGADGRQAAALVGIDLLLALFLGSVIQRLSIG